VAKFELPQGLEVDVVARKGTTCIVKRMLYLDAKEIKKKEGWTYDIFQIGFHAFKNTK